MVIDLYGDRARRQNASLCEDCGLRERKTCASCVLMRLYDGWCVVVAATAIADLFKTPRPVLCFLSDVMRTLIASPPCHRSCFFSVDVDAANEQALVCLKG